MQPQASPAPSPKAATPAFAVVSAAPASVRTGAPEPAKAGERFRALLAAAAPAGGIRGLPPPGALPCRRSAPASGQASPVSAGTVAPSAPAGAPVVATPLPATAQNTPTPAVTQTGLDTIASQAGPASSPKPLPGIRETARPASAAVPSKGQHSPPAIPQSDIAVPQAQAEAAPPAPPPPPPAAPALSWTLGAAASDAANAEAPGADETNVPAGDGIGQAAGGSPPTTPHTHTNTSADRGGGETPEVQASLPPSTPAQGLAEAKADAAISGAPAQPASGSASALVAPSPAPAQGPPQPSAPVAAASAPAHATPPPVAPVSQVAQAVTGVHIAAGASGQVTIHLQPAELGAVQVRIERAHDGTATVSVQVERADTLRALQQDLPHLHQALDRAGVPAEQRQVSFHLAPTAASAGSDPGFGPGADSQRQGQPGRSTRAALPPTASDEPTEPETPVWRPAGVNITA